MKLNSFKAMALLFVRSQRYSTAAYQFLDVTDTNKGYSILEMKRKPVNSLNLELIKELNNAIDYLEEDQRCNGIIITSKLPVFSAGLDIMEMYKPNIDHLKKFWLSFQDLFIRLYSTILVLLTAINGSCIAGGCAFSFTSDYCVMADNDEHRIGLSATKLGLFPPLWLLQSLQDLVGHREAEYMACHSVLLTPKDALRKGLVNSIVSQGSLMTHCQAHMEKLLLIPYLGRVKTKMLSRGNAISQFNENRERDCEVFVESVLTQSHQNTLEKYLKQLKSK